MPGMFDLSGAAAKLNGALFLCAGLGLNSPTVAQQSVPGQTLDAEFIEKVREVLLTHPEILEEAFTALQEKRLAEASAARRQAIADNAELIFDSANQIVLGNPDGDVTLVEFFDYNCGFCRRAAADLTALLEEDPNLRVVLKEFPILGSQSVEAARVSMAVSRIAPEVYEDFHMALLSSDARAGGDMALSIARDLGVDLRQLIEASTPEQVDAALQETHAIGSLLQITGTPAYILGDEVIEGAVGADSIRQKINAMRDCGKAVCS